MRAFFSFLLLALVGVAQALSYTGRRLLVVIEDASEKDKYSRFWGDLEGTPISLFSLTMRPNLSISS